MFRETWVLALFVAAISAYPNIPKSPASSAQLINVCLQSNITGKTEIYLNDFRTCVQDLVDLDQLKIEIQGAESDLSALSTLAKKYCDKTTQLKSCIHAYVDKVSPCGKKLHRTFLTNPLIDQDIDYLCHNNGEKIVSFIGGQGLECLEEKGSTFEQCGDQALASLSPVDRAAFDDDTISQAKLCSFTDQWFGCLVKVYKTCEHPAPGNFLEALYSFARKNSVCDAALPKN